MTGMTEMNSMSAKLRRRGWHWLGTVGISTVLMGTQLTPAAFSTPLAARVVGQVMDETNQPLADVTVVLSNPPATLQTLTDSTGAFELSADQEGRYRLEISHANREPYSQEVWLLPGLTTPVTITLKAAIQPQPRTRLGILGVGTLDRTRTLSQRLAAESVRLQAIPQQDGILVLDNQRLQPILYRVGLPLYELFDRERLQPGAVGDFLSYLGLRAVVIARVDTLERTSPEEVSLQSRSRLELWAVDDNGQLQITVLDQAGQGQTEKAPLAPAEVEQLFQIQTTRMMEEIQQRWQANNPLAPYLEPTTESPEQRELDTRVELVLPNP
ncbi:MAG: hypothetical protein OHK0012_14150 [Synechococcales cyanobacterium]